jgi:hypothetical protein
VVFLHRECAVNSFYTSFTELAPCILPPPISDFPGGEGESRFLDRGGQEHIQGEMGLSALGFKKFDIPEGASIGETQAILEANKMLSPKGSEL